MTLTPIRSALIAASIAVSLAACTSPSQSTQAVSTPQTPIEQPKTASALSDEGIHSAVKLKTLTGLTFRECNYEGEPDPRDEEYTPSFKLCAVTASEQLADAAFQKIEAQMKADNWDFVGTLGGQSYRQRFGDRKCQNWNRFETVDYTEIRVATLYTDTGKPVSEDGQHGVWLTQGTGPVCD